MFDNDKIRQDAFDMWLAEGLKKGPVPASDAFTRKVLSKAELLRSQKILLKITLQERIAGWVFYCAMAGGLGILLCPPILRAVYSILEDILRTLIYAALQPTRLDGVFIATVLVIIGLTAKNIWNWAVSDF